MAVADASEEAFRNPFAWDFEQMFRRAPPAEAKPPALARDSARQTHR
jgi:hypothetical protein